MIVDKISYQKTFPLAPYVNEKIGVEIQVEESDDWEDVFKTAKMMVEAFHKDNNPGLYVETNSEYETIEPYPYSGLPTTPSGTYATKVGDGNGTCNTIGITVESIKSCQQLMTLEKVYFPLIDKMKDKEKQRELWIAYDERYAQLANIQSIKQ